MNILYLTCSYLPVINGVSVVVQKIAEYMAKNGNNVEVITLRRSNSLPKLEEINGVLVRRIFGISPGGSYHLPFPSIYNNFKRGFDVVHVHNFHSTLPLVYWIGKNKIQCNNNVITPHYHVPGHFTHSKIAWFFYKPILSKMIRNFDHIHCVSNVEARRLLREFNVNSLVVENGVDSEIYDFVWTPLSDKSMTVIYIGRLEKYKRLDVLITAISLLQKKGYMIKLILVGSGNESTHLVTMSKQLNISMKIMQFLPRQHLLSLLSKSNCLVNPSLHEAFSLVTAEALAIGVPVVTVPPWGSIFNNYPRAIMKHPTPSSIAEGILETKNLTNKPRKHVPTWDEIGETIYNKIYLN